MANKNEIFAVDIKGLRQLQEGKPKWFIIRELLQNAMDEDIKTCTIYLEYKRGKAYIVVEDDSPIGFRDLTDIYTLFKETYKRSDVKKRGRFNLGEKQVLCLCEKATIVSTKGGMQFDMIKGERKTLRRKRAVGSEIYIEVKMTKEEYIECVKYCDHILPPDNIKILIVEDRTTEHQLSYDAPYKIFKAKLPTEIMDGDSMKVVTRETDVHIHRLHHERHKYIYEMGIPVCEIDCDYSIDVQQKVPLSNDRNNVDAKYLKLIYGEVLKYIIDDIVPEQSSQLWVRNGFASDRASTETRKDIIEKRFGEKSLIANPLDKRSMDEAISNGYNVVYGAEMSKEEWGFIREEGLLESTSSKFKTGVAHGKKVEPTQSMQNIALFCKKIAIEFLKINLTVSFFESPGASTKADYESESSHLRFNISHFNKSDWEPENGRVKQQMLDLIYHELGHSAGWHYEHSYHECITALASKVTIKALTNPGWFNL